MASGRAVLPATTLALLAVFASAQPAPAAPALDSAHSVGDLGTPSAARNPPQRRVVLLGLRPRGRLGRFVGRASNPSSPGYRSFLTLRQFRRRFSARRGDRRQVVRFLRSRQGVRRIELSSTRTVVLVVMTPKAARRTFCARGIGAPTRLCVPRRLRRSVHQISAGERYELGRARATRRPPTAHGSAAQGSPAGCQGALMAGGFTPNQLTTAYGVDGLHNRGLLGRGVRVVTLSGQPLGQVGLGVWARCFGMPKPRVRPIAMPSAVLTTATPSTEEALDIEALASLAPRLERITPIFVPLDQSFGHSFALFTFGALSRWRQGGRLPDVLSISDGVCEERFTAGQLQLAQRMLREASALGITALAASGDAGFLGCDVGRPGANFPNSSRFVTGVGGTQLTLGPDNRIAAQTVWSTFASQGSEGAGSGGGPSRAWKRPGFQRAPGVGPSLQAGARTRLGPDLAAMASFEPGIAVFDAGQGGWGADGGTSAATPLTAAMVALVVEQERRAGRPSLGSLPPLLYSLARGPDYRSIFYDITTGTSSQRPGSPAGQKPAGGAAQPGYDLATGLGSLDAGAFAAAVAAHGP